MQVYFHQFSNALFVKSPKKNGYASSWQVFFPDNKN